MKRSYKHVLAFDTSSPGIEVVYYNAETGDVYVNVLETERGQAEFLVPMAKDILDNNNVEFESLDACLCVAGPGSFTGIRIGISAAKSFGFSLSIPTLGVSALQVAALSYCKQKQVDQPIAVLLETKRQDFYFQLFDKNAKPMSDAIAADIQDIEPLIPNTATLIGSAADRFNLESSDIYKVDIAESLSLSQSIDQILGSSDRYTDNLQPIYLRPADVSQPKRPPQKIFL